METVERVGHIIIMDILCLFIEIGKIISYYLTAAVV
jgi:hypothetical protein